MLESVKSFAQEIVSTAVKKGYNQVKLRCDQANYRRFELNNHNITTEEPGSFDAGLKVSDGKNTYKLRSSSPEIKDLKMQLDCLPLGKNHQKNPRTANRLNILEHPRFQGSFPHIHATLVNFAEDLLSKSGMSKINIIYRESETCRIYNDNKGKMFILISPCQIVRLEMTAGDKEKVTLAAHAEVERKKIMNRKNAD